MLRHVAFIAQSDLATTLRQRETLLWVFVMPFLFFKFIGEVTGGMGGGGSDAPDPIALVAPEGSGFLADELAQRLEAQDFAVTRVASAAEAEGAARRLAIPDPPAGHASFTAALLAGEPCEVAFSSRSEDLRGDYDQVRVARAVYGVLADLAATSEAGGVPSAEGFRTLREQPRALSVSVQPAGKRVTVPSGYEQTIPGILVMFTMLVLLTSGATQLVVERERGLLRRLAATPISRAELVAGKWTGKMALASIQIAAAFLIGTVVFGMDWGDSVAMVAVVLICWAAFNASLGLLLANLARSEAQMAGIGVVVTMVLAALGGCWWPIEITPEWMQRLSRFLPSGLTMEAMHQLVSFGYGPERVVVHVLVLAGLALALGGLAVRSFRYQ